MLISVRNALESKNLVVENVTLKKRIAKAYQMIGTSKGLEGVKEMIDKVAPTQARVLITGPNGTGKELVAHQIHQKSERNKQPLIEVNCAADQLLLPARAASVRRCLDRVRPHLAPGTGIQRTP